MRMQSLQLMWNLWNLFSAIVLERQNKNKCDKLRHQIRHWRYVEKFYYLHDIKTGTNSAPIPIIVRNVPPSKMSRPPTADDLLSFKEFEPIGDAYSSTGHGAGGGHSSQHRAEININSPTRSAKPATLGSSSAFDEHFNIDDMSTSVNMMDDQTRTSAGRTMPASTSAATSLNVDDDSEGGEKPTATNYSFFTIEYYQQFFDVDTQIVMERILNAMVPRRASGSYLRQNIAKNPDLYGPFWIVVTLVGKSFVIAVQSSH